MKKGVPSKPADQSNPIGPNPKPTAGKPSGKAMASNKKGAGKSGRRS